MNGEGGNGRARRPSAPNGGAFGERALPVRKKIPHGPPPFPVAGPVVQFVTINASVRGGAPFLPVADRLLDSARFYHGLGRWFLHLFLVMPDHLHMLASFPSDCCVAVCGAWKRYVSRTFGISFQPNLFDCRIRDAAEFADKWSYIRQNPVRKGLVAMADEWPHWIAFDPRTGAAMGGRAVPARRMAARSENAPSPFP